MATLSEFIKTFKMWQIVVLVTVLVGAAGGTTGVYFLVINSEETSLGDDQQLIPVQLGDLVNQVSVNGSLIFPNTETLMFSTRANVGQILVQEGQGVSAGQPLIRADAETIATLEEAVAEARVKLQTAEEAFTDARSPHSVLEIAQAEAGVADARLDVKGAQDILGGLPMLAAQDRARAEAAVIAARIGLSDATDAVAELLTPPEQAVAMAENAVADAKLKLRDTQDELAGLLAPSAQDIAVAEDTVASTALRLKDADAGLAGLLAPTDEQMARAEAAVAEAGLAARDAQEALDTVKLGPVEEDLAKAQSAVTFAASALISAEGDLKLSRLDWDDRLELAKESIDPALTAYGDVFRSWLGIDVTEEQAVRNPDEVLEAWGVDLELLFGPRDLRLRTLEDDPETPWNEAIVNAWINFFPGTIVATCDDPVTGDQTLCVQQEMDDAWDGYDAALVNLDTVETLRAKEVANREEAVVRAADGLNDAQTALDDTRQDPDSLEVESLEKKLAIAQAVLQTAQEDLLTLLAGPDEVDVDGKRKEVAVAMALLQQAEEDLSALTGSPDPLEEESREKEVAVAMALLQQAEEDLSALTGNPDPLEMESRTKDVALATANLEQADEELARLVTGGFTLELEAKRQLLALSQARSAEAADELAELLGDIDPLELALLETEVVSARTALSGAIERLDGVTLEAPWEGVVTVINVEVGEEVNANTPVIEIVDPTVVEVDGIVDEIDVLFIREGAAARVTMDALPGQEILGSVSDIASAAQNQQGVVSYPIRIRLEVPRGTQFPEGLSAVANVVIREDRDVLLVPLQALYGSFDQPVVRVMFDGRVEEKTVVLGNNDDFWAVVVDGLAEGDQVVMESGQASADRFGAAGVFFSGFRGGFTGGGGGNFRRGGGGGGGGNRTAP
jgi:multidrug resistance efflux pump